MRIDSTVSEIDTVAEDGRIRGMICYRFASFPHAFTPLAQSKFHLSCATRSSVPGGLDSRAVEPQKQRKHRESRRTQ